MKNKLLFTLICCVFTLLSYSNDFVSIATGYWGDPLIWFDIDGGDPDGIPDSDDDVYIADNTIVTCTTSVVCANLFFDFSGLSGLEARLTIGSGGTVTINGTATIQDGNLSGEIATIFLVHSTAVLDINGDLVFSGVSVAKARIVYNQSGTVRLAGNITNSNGQISVGVAGRTGTFIYDGSVAQTIIIDGANIVYPHLTINNSAASPTAVTLGGNIATNNVWSDITISDGILTTGANTITGGASGDDFIINAGGELNISNTSSAFPTRFGVVTLNAASTVHYSAAGAQTISTQSYGNLSLSGSGTKTLAATTSPAGNLTVNTVTVGMAGFNLNVTGTYTNTGAVVYSGGGILDITGNFTNNASASLDLGTTAFNLGGNWTNDGAATISGTGLITFDGTLAQTIGGTVATTFNSLTLNNTSGASLTQAANLTGVLTISAGTFTTTGQNFTLISTAAGTASIAAITGGAAIAGNITMQRYAPASPNSNDWRFLSSAISGATIADWTDDFATSGFTGATCGPADCLSPGCAATCTFVSVYTYDETQPGDLEQGNTAAADVTDGISDGKGFWVYLGTTPVTFDVTGPPNTGDQATLDVSYTNTGDATAADYGWNLVPNPYPSAIDWDAANDGTHWDRSNIDDAIYIYNSSATNGGYASYVRGFGGVGVNGGSNLIASQQAFWVKASAAPGFTIRELCKANILTTNFLKVTNTPNTSHYPMAFGDFPVPLNTNQMPNVLRLTSSGNGYNDEIAIRFIQGATSNFDSQYDAWKVKGDYTNISSVIAGNKDLSISSLPPITSTMDIPIRFTVPATGTYSIRRDSILMLPLSSCILLEDKLTGTMTDFRTAISYSFSISDTTTAPRFVLHIYAPITKQSLTTACAGMNTGKAIAIGGGTGPWDYVWKDSGGNVLKTTLNSLTADTLHNCAAGTYSITVNGSVCGTVSDTIVVKPLYTLSSIVSQANVTCYDGNNGTATVAVTGGSPSYSYLWSNNQISSSATGLSAGNYSVIITDVNGCTFTTNVSINQPAVLAGSVITQTDVYCFGGNDGEAAVLATGGTGPYSYLWNNNQTTSWATGLAAGGHSVIITDVNGCIATASVTIAQPAFTITQTNVSCFGENDGAIFLTPPGGAGSYSYLWSTNQTTSSITGLLSGNYSVTVTNAEDGCIGTVTMSVTQPAVLTSTVSQTNVSCYGGNNGIAAVVPTGGTPFYSYLWDDGQTTPSVTGLFSGNYSLTITDANGCEAAVTASITEPALLIADYTASTYTVDLAVSNSVNFTNNSSGASSYQWNFGDASPTDASVNPAHAYTLTGTYIVKLVATNGTCPDTVSKIITVINSNPTAVNENNSLSSIDVVYDNGAPYLLFSLDKLTQVNIAVYNMTGEEIASQKNLYVKSGRIKLDIPSASAGIYIAISQMPDAIVSKKIFLPAR